MKVSIGEDERYPDYSFYVSIEENFRMKQVNVRKDKIKKWEKIVRDYEKLQEELAELFEEQ